MHIANWKLFAIKYLNCKNKYLIISGFLNKTKNKT